MFFLHLENVWTRQYEVILLEESGTMSLKDSVNAFCFTWMILLRRGIVGSWFRSVRSKWKKENLPWISGRRLLCKGRMGTLVLESFLWITRWHWLEILKIMVQKFETKKEVMGAAGFNLRPVLQSKQRKGLRLSPFCMPSHAMGRVWKCLTWGGVPKGGLGKPSKAFETKLYCLAWSKRD